MMLVLFANFRAASSAGSSLPDVSERRRLVSLFGKRLSVPLAMRSWIWKVDSIADRRLAVTSVTRASVTLVVSSTKVRRTHVPNPLGTVPVTLKDSTTFTSSTAAVRINRSNKTTVRTYPADTEADPSSRRSRRSLRVATKSSRSCLIARRWRTGSVCRADWP